MILPHPLIRAMAKPSFYLSEDELAILDATAERLGISRSEVARHLILYHGMCGGDFPLTSRILSLPVAERDRLIAGIRRKVQSGDPSRPGDFSQWVKEALANPSAGPREEEDGLDALLKRLLEG